MVDDVGGHQPHLERLRFAPPHRLVIKSWDLSGLSLLHACTATSCSGVIHRAPASAPRERVFAIVLSALNNLAGLSSAVFYLLPTPNQADLASGVTLTSKARMTAYLPQINVDEHQIDLRTDCVPPPLRLDSLDLGQAPGKGQLDPPLATSSHEQPRSRTQASCARS